MKGYFGYDGLGAMKTVSDKQVEVPVAHMLAVGVSLSAIIILCGGVLYLFGNSATHVDYSHFHAASPALTHVAGVIDGVMALHPESVMQLGLFLLIATPLVRVMFCIVGFLRQRDFLYVGISAAVLAILIYSFIQPAR
jgi:uncharacterized membrane protein